MKYLILIVTGLIFSSQTIFANSSVELKVELSNTDCSINESIVYINLFVKKADQVSEAVKLQNQNYRLSYDASTLVFDSFFIDGEGALSNFGTNPDGSFYLFASHTLVGTTENIVSYNIDMQGGEGFELTHDWVLIGTLGAHLRSNVECYSSILLKENDFPPTTLLYTRNSGQTIVDKYPVTFNLNECIVNHCSNCHPNLDLNTVDHNYLNGEILNHQVQDFISADNIIGANSEVTFDVTNQALLKPGFEVKSNANFEVKLEGCQ